MATTTLPGRHVRLRPGRRVARTSWRRRPGGYAIDFERLRPWMGSASADVVSGSDSGRVASGTRQRIRGVFLVLLAVSSLLWYYSLAVLVVSRGTPLLGGWDVSSVLTGSMYPALHPGDLVAYEPVDPSELRPGRIVVYDDPVRLGGTVVHRIVEQRPDGTFVTKGDANQAADSTPIVGDAIRGVVTMVTPHAGLPTMWLSKSEWLPLSLLVIALLVAGLVVHRDDDVPRSRYPSFDKARREAVKSLARPVTLDSRRSRRRHAEGPMVRGAVA